MKILPLLLLPLSVLADTHVTITDTTASVQASRPITISRVFKQADIPNYPRPSVSGTALTQWQANVMNRWPDGSVKHALISFAQTIGATASVGVLFINDANPCHLGNQAACDAAAPTQAQILAFNGGAWGASINTTEAGVNFAVSARAMVAAGSWRFWVKGPLCNQIIVEDRSAALSFDFGYKNNFFLSGDFHTPYVGPTDTAIPVIDASAVGSLAFPTTVQWEGEQISICSVSGNTLNVCSGGRGYGGTTAGNHATFRSDTAPINVLAYANPSYVAAPTAAYKSLHPIFVLTQYAGWAGVKEEFILESPWVQRLQKQVYDLTLKSGASLATTQFSKVGYQHPIASRWRQVFWDGSTPGNVNVDYNLTYMVSTLAIPNYDTSKVVPAGVISSQVSSFTSSDQGAMGGHGQWQADFSAVGGRPDLGMVPTWTIQYLFTFDPGLYNVVMGNAAAGGYIPVHYRESDPARWFDSGHSISGLGHTLSVDGRNLALSDYGYSEQSYGYGEFATFLGENYRAGWVPDLAHQADFAYIPYLISGDWYFLEEMQFWSSFNLSFAAAGSTDYLGRHSDWGFLPFSVETRGQAWAMRNLATAWFMSPTGDVEGAHILEKIRNNIAIREGQYSITNGAFPPSDSTCAGYNENTTTDKWCWGLKTINAGVAVNPLRFVSAPSVNQDSSDMDATKECEQDSPWMINLNHMVWGYMDELGITQIHPMRVDLAANLLGQILDPGYAQNGTGWLTDSYRYGVLANPSGLANGCPSDRTALTYFTTWSASRASQLSSVLATHGPSEWAGRNPDAEFGYTNIIRAAASFMTQIVSPYNGLTAWNWVLSTTNDSNLNNNPRWALMPRNIVPATAATIPSSSSQNVVFSGKASVQ